jgi:hypothetical protein
MATVADLIPGDLVTNAGARAVYVTRTEHPLWPHLQLVVWQLHTPHKRWSFDALDPAQEVGYVTRSTDADRTLRLRAALLAGPQT